MSGAPLLVIDDLRATTAATDHEPEIEILTGVSLTVEQGETHALVGPEGSGAEAVASILLGSPGFEVTSGRILFQGDDVTSWDTDVRAKAGLFLAFRDPQEIAGISVLTFLQQALGARTGAEMSVRELQLALTGWIERLGLDPALLDRSVNEGASVGEKKRNEVLQMAMLEPEMAILDETDTGLDVATLSAVAAGVRSVRADRPSLGTLTITHCQRPLDHLQPDQVHLLVDGTLVASGGPELADQLETEGYESFT